ncbi:MAG: hypothetical protein Q9226_008215, partial [Calogaya cf. arnoldii]
MKHGFLLYALTALAASDTVSGHAVNYTAPDHVDHAALATGTGSPLRARHHPSYPLSNSTESPCPTGNAAPLRWIRRQLDLGTAVSSAQSSPTPEAPNLPSRLLGFLSNPLARRNHEPPYPIQNSSMPTGLTGSGSSPAMPVATPVGQIGDGQVQAPVNQISDGQVQAPVSQISDGQVQVRSASIATPVSQISDRQVQASAGPVETSQHPAVAPYPIANSTNVVVPSISAPSVPKSSTSVHTPKTPGHSLSYTNTTMPETSSAAKPTGSPVLSSQGPTTITLK